LVDQYIVNNKPEKINDYQSLLLKQYLSKINIQLAHSFNYSLIKYRIKMMTKNKSKWWAKYKLFFAIPIIIIGLVAFSNADMELANKLGNNGDEFELQPEGMVFIPQGSFVMKRSDGHITKEFDVSVDPFWMKETEVSVKEYYEYLESVKKDTTLDVYNTAIPDFSKAPYENYFTSKKYQDYPIVGITLPQAKKFCNWKTNTENKKLLSQGKQPIHNYRIPLEAEWIYASFGGMNPDEIVKPEISSLTKTGSKKPNDWGLYNMFDNVSEWTANILNPSLRLTMSSQYGKGLPVVQRRDISDSTSEWQTIDIKPGQFINYLDSLNLQKGQTIVKGNSYRNLAVDENQILESSIAYDYVGFRYVRSYLGKQNQ
jgi:sulfatase modifying factor 1